MADRNKPSSLGTRKRKAEEQTKQNNPEISSKNRLEIPSDDDHIEDIIESKQKQNKTGNDEMSVIKQQLSEIMKIVPAFKVMKDAFDKEQEQIRMEEEEGNDQEEDDDIIVEMGKRAKTDDSIISTAKTVETEEGEIEEEIDEEVAYFKNTADVSKKAGPVVNKAIAEGVAKILSNGLETEKKEEIEKKYHIPENCARLNVIKVDEDIYKAASKSTRINDSNLQTVQQDIAKTISANIYTFEKLVEMGKTKEDTDQKEALKLIKKSASDSISLLANVSHKIDLMRRQQFKTDFKKEFSTLCTAEYPVEGTLFGKGMSEKVKEITEAAKLSNQVVAGAASKFKKGPQFKNRRPFFGAGGSQVYKRQQGSHNKYDYKYKQQQQQHKRFQGQNQKNTGGYKKAYNQRK